MSFLVFAGAYRQRAVKTEPYQFRVWMRLAAAEDLKPSDGATARPRSATVMITKNDGGVIGL
jgi:hypothetical protein